MQKSTEIFYPVEAHERLFQRILILIVYLLVIAHGSVYKLYRLLPTRSLSHTNNVTWRLFLLSGDIDICMRERFSMSEVVL